MGASDPPPEHHSGVLEFCGGMMLNKLQNGNEGTTLIKEDRISHLPDHILGDILAFLPLKDAVATSVLSRRWRRVFTWVTYLNLDDTPNSYDYCLMRSPHTIDSFPNFKMYVDKVLQLCHSNNMDISTYILHFGKRKECFHPRCFEGCLPELDPMHLDAWISFPLARGVKVLDIIARVRKPSKIPSALYRCATLEVLKLDVNVNNLDLNIPYSIRIRLPNLKVVHLTFLKHTPNNDSVARLVASCPPLQDLVLNVDCWIHINYITSQSLRRLVINFPSNTWYDDTPKTPPRSEFELDVPNLEHLKYVDSTVFVYSITKMNNLVDAQVDVVDLHLDGTILGIFSGLSNVRSLYLMSRTTNTMTLLIACDTIIKHKLPLFVNLKHLQLGCEGYYNWNNVLIELLHRAPFLETLTFTEGITGGNDVLEERYREVFLEECEAWSKAEEIPSYLRVQLKRITIYDYLCTQGEMEVVKYFLRNSSVLEELILICFSQSSRPVTIEAKMLLDNTFV